MECKWHSCTNEVTGRPNKKFCSPPCKNNYFVTQRRHSLKVELVAYKGGECERCGFDDHPAALTFHHRDPSQKEFGISAMGHTRSLDRLKVEADKCHLLCLNCHQIIHAINDPQWVIIPV